MKFAQIIMLLCQFVHRWCLFFVIYVFQNILSVCCNPLHVLGMPLGNLFGQELQSRTWIMFRLWIPPVCMRSRGLQVTIKNWFSEYAMVFIVCNAQMYYMHCITQITRFNRFIRLFSAGATSSLVCRRLHWKSDKPAGHCLSYWLSLLKR